MASVDKRLAKRCVAICRFRGGLANNNLGGFDGEGCVGGDFAGSTLDGLIQVMFRDNSIDQP